jgi:ABC-type nitrate/sulfonate/bicarbonate transport system permease component
MAAIAPAPTSSTSAALDTHGERRAVPPWLGGLVGTLILIGLWQLAGMTIFKASGTVPPPTKILSQMRADGFDFYWSNAKVTMHEALIGYLWGNALAIFLALLVLLAPFLERPFMRLGVLSYCLPVIAIGPVLQIVFNGENPKIILAALSVFFTTLVGMLVGLRSADAISLDVVHAYGGGGFHKLFKVRVRAALPSLFVALRIAAPAAVLGAIIGEYVGGESGLGIAMIASQSGLRVATTWGIALVATFIAGAAYGLTALIGNLLTPWAPRGAAR